MADRDALLRLLAAQAQMQHMMSGQQQQRGASTSSASSMAGWQRDMAMWQQMAAASQGQSRESFEQTVTRLAQAASAAKTTVKGSCSPPAGTAASSSASPSTVPSTPQTPQQQLQAMVAMATAGVTPNKGDKPEPGEIPNPVKVQAAHLQAAALAHAQALAAAQHAAIQQAKQQQAAAQKATQLAALKAAQQAAAAKAKADAAKKAEQQRQQMHALSALAQLNGMGGLAGLGAAFNAAVAASTSASTSNGGGGGGGGHMSAEQQALAWQLLAAQMMQQHIKAAAAGAKKTPVRDNGRAPAKTSPVSSDKTRDDEDGLDGRKDRRGMPADAEMCRVPLEHGWRRQTCVRSITAGNLRGDVIYFAPCGKKLSSYAEVIRYLSRLPSGPIHRDHFSFSCKLLVGEFLHFRDLDGHKGMAVLSEEEMADELRRLTKPIKVEKGRNGRKRAAEEDDELFEEEGEEEGRNTPERADGERIGRQPEEDLNIDELRPLPDLSRIENLCLPASAFADVLQVHEFLSNFAHVLHIDSSSLPSMECLSAAVAGDAETADQLRALTRLLLERALQVPGLPQGRRAKGLAATYHDVPLTRDNYSELMRVLLENRDKRGKELAAPLLLHHFELISPSERAAILAYLCDELLQSRNVVKEIERTLEDMSRLRGERWMREGKVRALRNVQSKKRKEAEVREEQAANHTHHAEPSVAAAEDEPMETSEEPATKKKTFTPGLGQCEILTEEEEALDVTGLEHLISTLNGEADGLREKVGELSSKVRTFPFGQDRYHRMYWTLPHTRGILVESVESAGRMNPACNAADVCARDPPAINVSSSPFIDPDVVACVEDVVDQLVGVGRKDAKGKKRRARKMANKHKRGWWCVATTEQAEQLRASLHGRGIRERALHRLMIRDHFQAHHPITPLRVHRTGPLQTEASLARHAMMRLNGRLGDLERRIREAGMEQDDYPEPMQQGQHDQATFDPNESWSGSVEKMEEEENGLSIDCEMDPLDEELKWERVRLRLLECEARLQRKYLRQHFHKIDMCRVDGCVDREGEEEEGEEIDMGGMEGGDEVSQTAEEWRRAVHEATTCHALTVLLQILDKAIAWERSWVLCVCQLCGEEGGEACAGCGLHWHAGCVRGQMGEGWLCARCHTHNDGKTRCLLCSAHEPTLIHCTRCCSRFHADCAGCPADHARSFVCECCVGKRPPRTLLPRDSLSPSPPPEDKPTVNGGSAYSRPAPKKGANQHTTQQQTVVFPREMLQDCCRTMLDEMEQQPSVGPFLDPVDVDLIPEYKQVIANPIDLQTIRCRVDKAEYDTSEEFAADMELMFSNCREFNEDDSPTGKAGNSLHKFYAKRWRQVKYNYSKRLKRKNGIQC